MILVAYSVLAVVLLLPGLLSGPSLDAAVFTVTAGQLANGDVLYVTAWDHKPPGIYLLYAAPQLLLGWLDPWLLTWLISVGVAAALGYVIYLAILRLEVRPWPARLAGGAVVLVAGQYLFALGGGLTEPVAALLAATALLLALADRLRAARTALIGLLLALAVVVSLQLAIGAVVIGLLAVARTEAGGRLRSAGAGLVGAAIPVIAIGGWLAAIGAGAPAVDAVFGYAAAYRGTNAAIGADLSGSVAAWSTLAVVFLLVPAGLGALDARRRGGVRAKVAAASLAWLLLGLVAFAIQGRFIAHYAIPLAIPLAALAGLGLDRLLSRPRLMLAIPLAAPLAISLLAGVLGGAMEWQAVEAQHGRAEAVGDYLGDTTDPADTILVWGNAPALYLAAGRDPATAYSFLYPLTTHGYSTSGQVETVLQQLEASPPAAVVDAGSAVPGEAGFVPLLEPRPVATDGRDLDLLDPLRDFVGEHYRLAGIVSGWPVYVLR